MIFEEICLVLHTFPEPYQNITKDMNAINFGKCFKMGQNYLASRQLFLELGVALNLILRSLNTWTFGLKTFVIH